MEQTKLSAADQQVLQAVHAYLSHETVVYSYKTHAECVVNGKGIVVYEEFDPSGQASGPYILVTDGTSVLNVLEETVATYVDGKVEIVPED